MLLNTHTDPKAAAEMFSSNAEARELMTELSSILGGHFEKLGADNDAQIAAAQQAAFDAELAKHGPLAQAAMLKHAAQQKDSSSSSSTNSSQTAASTKQKKTKIVEVEVEEVDPVANDVALVLADTELKSLLMDPELQRVLQQCGEPGKLRHFMSHPEFGPKIKRLAQAGLVQIQ
jgi:chemotaxis protein histidine kinase CheA